MRRSLLFIPANSPAMLQNADVFSADAVIFDLEDAVSIYEKDAALSLLNQFLKTFELKGLEIIVRINDLDSQFYSKDLSLLNLDKIDTLMLPKATVKHLQELNQWLDEHKKDLKIIPIIESAKSVVEIDEIAKQKRVSGLLLGGEDLATDLEVERTEKSDELFLSRAMVVIAAKANQIDAIDTPYTDTKNDEGLKQDTLFAKSLGMTAKVAIHPNQIDLINETFAPSQQEIDHALKIMSAYETAQEQHKGVFSVDGKMIDKPIIDRAKITLKKAKAWHLL